MTDPDQTPLPDKTDGHALAISRIEGKIDTMTAMLHDFFSELQRERETVRRLTERVAYLEGDRPEANGHG